MEQTALYLALCEWRQILCARHGIDSDEEYEVMYNRHWYHVDAFVRGVK